MTFEEFRARLPEGSSNRTDRALFDKCSESEREFLIKHEWLHELVGRNYTMKDIGIGARDKIAHANMKAAIAKHQGAITKYPSKKPKR